VFTNKKRESINTFVRAVSLYVTETPKTSTRDHESSLPIMSFGFVAYGFVGQPFSKELYKPLTTHNSLIRSDEGLTLETSAFESLYGS